jgi:hypothetical protein
MLGTQSVKVSAGIKEVSLEIVTLQVQNGPTGQIAADSGQVSSAQQDAVKRVAESAATRLVKQASQAPEVRMKILWIDDHPQNNIGLQYAFQALGMMFICIDSNASMASSFATAGGFDVAITDMYRDAIRDRPAEPEGGWQTVSMIKNEHPGVPAII